MTQEGFDDLTDEDGADETEAPAPAPFFGRLVTAGRSTEDDLRLTLPEHTVGRLPTNSLVLCYPFISSTHARIRSGAGGMSIEDASTNGIWLNGQKMTTREPHALTHNDEVAFAPPRAENADPTTQPELRYTFVSAGELPTAVAQPAATVVADDGSTGTPVAAAPPSSAAASSSSAAASAGQEE